MIGTPIKIRNHDTGQEITINDHSDPLNVIALQSFPTFETDVRPQNVARNGAHGEFRLPTYYSGMSIVLQGVIAGEDESHVWTLKRQLDSIMRLSRAGYGKEVPSVSINPPVAINECTNPNGGISDIGWTPANASVASVGNALEVTTSSAGESGISHVVSSYPKNQGDLYIASSLVTNREESTRSFRILIQARASGGSVLSSDSEDFEIEAGKSERIGVSLSALPASVVDIRVSITRLSEDAVSGDRFEVSSVLIAKNLPEEYDSESFYFDGSTPSASRIKYSWVGTEGLSASVANKQTFPSMFRNTVRLSFTNPEGKSVFVDATPIKAISYDREMRQNYRLDFQVILRSNFPVLIVDESVPVVSVGQLGSDISGLKLPFQVPFTLSERYVEGATVINVTDPGFAIVRMYGSDEGTIINPRITNITNGTSMRILKPLEGSHRYFLIDGMYQKIVDENGASVAQFSDGEFIQLEAGENTLIYTAEKLISN